MSALLLPSASPIFILRPAPYPFKERSTDMCNVVTNPIIWNFSPPIQVHCMSPKWWEGSKLWRALLLKGLTTSTQKSLTAGAQLSLYLASLQ